MAADSSGMVHVVWLDVDNLASGSGRILHRRKVSATWSPPEVILGEAVWTEASGIPALTVDPMGNVYLVAASATIEPSVSFVRWNGSAWLDAGVPMTATRSAFGAARLKSWASEQNAAPARAAIGKGGKVHVVWRGDADPSDIRYSLWDGTMWSPAESLTHATQGFANPVVSVDGFDSVHILWNGSNAWNNQGDVFYIRRDNPRP